MPAVVDLREWRAQPPAPAPLNEVYRAIGAYTAVTSSAPNQAKKYPKLIANGAPTLGAGPAGLQWNLNGSSQYFTENIGYAQLEGFTIIAIGTPTNVAGNGAIATLANLGYANGSFGLRVNAGVVGAYAYSSAGAFNESVHAVSAVNNKPYVFGAVFASDARRTVYLNGTPGTPNTTSGAVTAASQFSIGVLNRSGITQYWQGGIGDVFILPWALTDAEMARMRTPADVYGLMYAPEEDSTYFSASSGVTLAATATAQSTATADLSHGVTLAGAALSVASATAGMSHSVPLAATATATASASGNIALSVTLAASAVAQAVATAALTVTGSSSLAANAAAVASAGATLALAVNLSASAIAQAVASAELGGSSTLAAAAIANAQATSALAVGKPLAAGAQGASTASASLWVQVPLSAAALAQAAAGASLNLTVTLAANALGNASASASLPGTVTLAAAGVSVATAGATLQIGGAIDPALNRMLTVRQMPRNWSHTQRHRTFVVVT